MVREIPKHNYTHREQTVVDLLKTLDTEINSFTNVGFHDWQDPRRHWWIKICEANGIEWNIVEVFEPNVKDAISKGCPPQKIFNLSISEVDTLPNTDCLLFWHGPEHLYKEEFLDVLKKLEQKYKVLIFGMPLGEEPQGEAYGNPYEKHVSSWERKEWEELGYTVFEVHDHQRYPHITVYKVMG
jgi:hypothetical protein